MTHRYIVTGGRHYGETAEQLSAIRAVLRHIPKAWIQVNGAYETGLDFYAAREWRTMGGTVEEHPADWDTYDKAAGPMRNQEMVDLGAEFLLAFPGGDGTADCMRRAKKAGIDVRTTIGNFEEAARRRWGGSQ